MSHIDASIIHLPMKLMRLYCSRCCSDLVQIIPGTAIVHYITTQYNFVFLLNCLAANKMYASLFYCELSLSIYFVCVIPLLHYSFMQFFV